MIRGFGETIPLGAAEVFLPTVIRYFGEPDGFYEPNDNWQEAYGPLVFDQVYEAYPNDTEDYYYVQLAAGATINVSVEDYVPTSSYGTLALYGPAAGDEGQFLSE